MRITYDETADALYVRVAADGVEISRTPELDPGTLIDIDHEGHLVGIEVIHPAREWPVEQVISDYTVSEADAPVLRSLWTGREEMHPVAPSRRISPET